MPSSQQTVTDIANLALAHCGVTKKVSDVTERSLEAQMIRTFFDIARRSVIRDGRWLFSIKQITPAIVAQMPTPEWNYAYGYPADCLKVFRFVSPRLTNDTRQSRIPYTIMQPVPVTLSQLTTPPVSYYQDTGEWIYTNWPGVNNGAWPTILEYAFDNTNVSQWTDDFCMGFSKKLAYFIAPGITQNQPGLQDKLDTSYQAFIKDAFGADLNEEQRPQDPQSEWIRAREGFTECGPNGENYTPLPSGFVIL